jgi:hypothetical protein
MIPTPGFSLRPCALAAVAMFLCASRATPEILKLREVEVSPKRDRGIAFAAEVTHSGDLLSFVANNTGTWQLYRVRNWDMGKASVDALAIPGFFSKADVQDTDGRRIEMLTPQVFATPDGAYAMCVANAWWVKRAHGRAEGRSRF